MQSHGNPVSVFYKNHHWDSENSCDSPRASIAWIPPPLPSPNSLCHWPWCKPPGCCYSLVVLHSTIHTSFLFQICPLTELQSILQCFYMTPVWKVFCPTDVLIWKERSINSCIFSPCKQLVSGCSRGWIWKSRGFREKETESYPFYPNRTANLGQNKRHGCYGNWFQNTKRPCWVLPRLKNERWCLCLEFVVVIIKVRLGKRYLLPKSSRTLKPPKVAGTQHPARVIVGRNQLKILNWERGM